jgi:hypothetical protein
MVEGLGFRGKSRLEVSLAKDCDSVRARAVAARQARFAKECFRGLSRAGALRHARLLTHLELQARLLQAGKTPAELGL